MSPDFIKLFNKITEVGITLLTLLYHAENYTISTPQSQLIMKTFYARLLAVAFLVLQASQSQASDFNPLVPINPPKIYHTNDQIDDLIYTRLTPVHPDSLYQATANEMQDSIIDNDGNMYVTTWELGDKNSVDFLADQKTCNQKIYGRMIIERAFDINEIREEDIQPSLFKEHFRCIFSHGYTPKERKGFSPDKFQLNIFRSYLKPSSNMSGGTIIYLYKKSALYIDVYKNLNQCVVEAKKTDNSSPEEYSDTYISIRPYVESTELCMKNLGYRIEKADSENH